MEENKRKVAWFRHYQEVMSLPLDVDSLKIDVLIYSNKSNAFKFAANLGVEYKLIDVNNKFLLKSVVKVPVVEKADEFRSRAKVAIGVRQYRGRKIFLGLGHKVRDFHLLRSWGDKVIFRRLEMSPTTVNFNLLASYWTDSSISTTFMSILWSLLVVTRLINSERFTAPV